MKGVKPLYYFAFKYNNRIYWVQISSVAYDLGMINGHFSKVLKDLLAQKATFLDEKKSHKRLNRGCFGGVVSKKSRCKKGLPFLKGGFLLTPMFFYEKECFYETPADFDRFLGFLVLVLPARIRLAFIFLANSKGSLAKTRPSTSSIELA